MIIEIDRKTLKANCDPNGHEWDFENPFQRLAEIWKEATTSHTWDAGDRHHDASLNAGSLTLFVNQGGIQNRIFNIHVQERKKLFRGALRNINRIYADVTDKFTGKIILHAASRMLKRVEIIPT